MFLDGELNRSRIRRRFSSTPRKQSRFHPILRAACWISARLRFQSQFNDAISGGAIGQRCVQQPVQKESNNFKLVISPRFQTGAVRAGGTAAGTSAQALRAAALRMSLAPLVRR